MPHDILLAVVIGAQGLKGAVRVKTFTQSPDALARYGALHDRNGRGLSITTLRVTMPGEAVIAFDGVATRAAAEALKGVELFVAREALPAPGEEEFYHADLIGLAAEDAQGRVFGVVSALHNFGAGDVIEIKRTGGDPVQLPFTRQIVPVIDIANGRVVIAMPDFVEGEEAP
jgi:16S rRNA processing protein RimM